MAAGGGKATGLDRQENGLRQRHVGDGRVNGGARASYKDAEDVKKRMKVEVPSITSMPAADLVN